MLSVGIRCLLSAKSGHRPKEAVFATSVRYRSSVLISTPPASPMRPSGEVPIVSSLLRTRQAHAIPSLRV